LNQPKKPKKVGRPKLPKGEAKGRIVPVRFAADDLKAIEAAAKSKNQSVSEWIRGTLDAALHV
jgi:predicted HicB family RNase H-like nuclease